jgi:hypothetical protein
MGYSISSFVAEPKSCQNSAVQTLVQTEVIQVSHKASFFYRLLVWSSSSHQSTTPYSSSPSLWRATHQHCTTAAVLRSCFNYDPALGFNQSTDITVNVLMCCLSIILLKFYLIQCSLVSLIRYGSIIVAARSKAWTVFARSSAGIVLSIPTQGMYICVHLFCVCVVLCVGSGLATGWSPAQGVLRLCMD